MSPNLQCDSATPYSPTEHINPYPSWANVSPSSHVNLSPCPSNYDISHSHPDWEVTQSSPDENFLPNSPAGNVAGQEHLFWHSLRNVPPPHSENIYPGSPVGNIAPYPLLWVRISISALLLETSLPSERECLFRLSCGKHCSLSIPLTKKQTHHPSTS